jgi:hypothetical protein
MSKLYARAHIFLKLYLSLSRIYFFLSNPESTITPRINKIIPGVKPAKKIKDNSAPSNNIPPMNTISPKAKLKIMRKGKRISAPAKETKPNNK